MKRIDWSTEPRNHVAREIHVGDVVALKAGGYAMLVLDVKKGCDGTGGDGWGLLCCWPNGDGAAGIGWISQSAVNCMNLAVAP